MWRSWRSCKMLHDETLGFMCGLARSAGHLFTTRSIFKQKQTQIEIPVWLLHTDSFKRMLLAFKWNWRQMLKCAIQMHVCLRVHVNLCHEEIQVFDIQKKVVVQNKLKIVVVWRLHYINTLKHEPSSTKTYERTSSDEKSIFDNSCYHIELNLARNEEHIFFSSDEHNYTLSKSLWSTFLSFG